MNKSEFGRIAVCEGWTRHGEIDTYFLKKLDDRMVQIIPSVRSVTAGTSIDLSESCITEEMKLAMDFVAGESSWPGILCKRRPPTRITLPSFTESDVRSLLVGAESWASRVNRTEALERYANFATDAAPGNIVSHFVALMLLDRRETVEGYYETFDDGNPNSFVQYVTKNMIGRALELERQIDGNPAP